MKYRCIKDMYYEENYDEDTKELGFKKDEVYKVYFYDLRPFMIDESDEVNAISNQEEWLNEYFEKITE